MWSFDDWLLGPCDPKWRFPTVCMVGFVFGLEKVSMHTYIYRQARFVLGGFAQALPGARGGHGGWGMHEGPRLWSKICLATWAERSYKIEKQIAKNLVQSGQGKEVVAVGVGYIS